MCFVTTYIKLSSQAWLFTQELIIYTAIVQIKNTNITLKSQMYYILVVQFKEICNVGSYENPGFTIITDILPFRGLV